MTTRTTGPERLGGSADAPACKLISALRLVLGD